MTSTIIVWIIFLRISVTREAKKSLLIATVLITLCLLVGNGIMLDFETEIFVETGSSLSPAKSSVIVIVVKVIANLLVLYVVDHFDRRVWSTTKRLFSTFSRIEKKTRIFIVSGLVDDIIYRNSNSLCGIRNLLHVLFAYTLLGMAAAILPGNNHICWMRGCSTDLIYYYQWNFPGKSR